ncbi:MAG: insulinase family protein [Clostridia bacterium]|nr:insulinase family protein [Clostridia bacterium]
MSKETKEIKAGIKAHFIQTDLFKTNLVCVFITVPLTRENVTKNALIPFILKSGSKILPTQYLINEKMESLYGANFECGVDKLGDNQVFKFYIDAINNEYALENEDILKETIDSLLDIVFNPVLEKDKFKKEFIDIEKENLKTIIDSKIDDKDMYAYDRCISEMYNNKNFGIYKYGYEEDLEKIDEDNLTEHYNYLIQNSKIDIYISGKYDINKVQTDIMENENIKKLKPRIENYILNNEYTESKQNVDNIKEIIEKMEVTQGKLVIGLDVVSNIENLQCVSLVYNAILGDGASSMLFQNVREKAGLAYSARSNYIKQKANIFIRCGIQIENFEKALNIVKDQLENMKKGNFTDEDIENAKKYLIAGIKTIEEEQDSEVIFYIGQEIAKTNRTVKEYIELIEKVKRDEILEIAKAVQINTIYFLRD